jgi:hypothetical protein
MFAVENERISPGGFNVHIYALDCSSFFMLAVGVVGVGTVSHRLDSDASVPNHWFNDEWTLFFPYCTDYAAWENSSWTGSKVKKYKFRSPLKAIPVFFPAHV